MKYCLGTVQFGLNYGIQENGQPQKEEVDEILSYAIESGIDILDTASAYGEAEDVLGNYIRAYSKISKQVQVVSKLRPDAFTGQPIEKWADIALMNAKESLKRLGIDKFAVYLFHNASYIYDRNAVEALYEVKRQKLADRIGVSIYTPEEAMKALEYSEISAIQIPYNLFDRRLDHCQFFSKAKEKDVLVFARSSLLQGLLMMDPEHLPQKVFFAKDYIKRFLDICREYHLDPLQAAIGYVGCKKEIDYVVFGVDNIDQLKEYLSLKDVKFPSKMIVDMEQAFDNVEERLVNPALWK